MVDRPFEANRLDHGDDFLRTGTGRDSANSPNQPSTFHHYIGTDWRCRWIEQNQPSISRDSINSVGQQSNPYKSHGGYSATPKKFTPWTLQGGESIEPLLSNHEQRGATLAISSTPGKPSKPHTPTKWGAPDPPSLVDEDEGLKSPYTLINERSYESLSSSESLNYFTASSNSHSSISTYEDWADDLTEATSSLVHSSYDGFEFDQDLPHETAEEFLDREILQDQELLFHQMILNEIARFGGFEDDGLTDKDSINIAKISLNDSIHDSTVDEEIKTIASNGLPLVRIHGIRYKNTNHIAKHRKKRIRTIRYSTESNIMGVRGPGVKQSQVHNNHQIPHWKVTICICKRLRNVQFSASVAMQQIALLRRCFFPRRDVIKWG
jgi:hypothetical protein